MKGENDDIRDLQHQIAMYEDMKAYARLYDLLFDGLHRFSFVLVKSSEVAEEIVSDVFIKLWEIRNKLPDIVNLKVYLYTVTRNFSLNYITKHYKHPIVSLREMEVECMIEIGNPEDICISADSIERIREAIRQLPPQCQIIFQLVKEEGLPYKEVAAILQLSPLTVRNQVAIATRKIAALIPVSLHPKAAQSLRKFSDS